MGRWEDRERVKEKRKRDEVKENKRKKGEEAGKCGRRRGRREEEEGNRANWDPDKERPTKNRRGKTVLVHTINSST